MKYFVILTILTLQTFTTMSFATKKEIQYPEIKFGTFGCLHLGVGAKNNDIKVYERSHEILRMTVTELNRRNDLNFVMILGDLLKDGEPYNLDIAMQMLRRLNTTYHMMVGNHDYAPVLGTGISKTTFINAFQETSFNGMKGYYSFDVNSWLHITVLDTTLIGETGGEVDPKQIDWLKRDLEANQDETIILFSHHPLAIHHPDDEKKGWKIFPCANYKEIHAIIKEQTQVKAVITGHHHLGDMKMVDGVPYFTCHSLLTYPCRYWIFGIKPDRLTYKSVSIPDANIIKEAKDSFTNGMFRLPSLVEPADQALSAILKAVEGDWEDNSGEIILR